MFRDGFLQRSDGYFQRAGFFVISHDRRRIVHCNVTRHPTSLWIVQQLQEVFPFDSAPRFLIFDRDAKYGWEVATAVGWAAAGVNCWITSSPSMPGRRTHSLPSGRYIITATIGRAPPSL